MLALAAGLTWETRAHAQSVTLGSPLTAPPNISVDCAAQPAIADPQGNYGLFASGQSDCTWRQSGVFGAPAGDTRFSSAPGDGRITSISVRSGPNPAPLRFVVLRQLSTPGFGAEAQCCFFVSETNEVRPQPNTVTTFTTNIPVQRNTIDGIFAVDLIGVSARSGAGSLPLSSTGRNNAFQLTEFGSVNAGFFYPRIGALGNDSGGGRREDGIPGVEVLMRWTWVPAAVGPAVLNTAAQVVRNGALIDVICNGNAACRGVLEVLAAARGVARSRTRLLAQPRRGSLFGKKSYSIGAGQSGTVRVLLKKRARKLLKKNGSLPVVVRLKPAQGAEQSFRVTLLQ